MKKFILFLALFSVTSGLYCQTNTWWAHTNFPTTETPIFEGVQPPFRIATDTVNNITYASEITETIASRKVLYSFDGDLWQIIGFYYGDINVMCMYRGYLYVGSTSFVYYNYNDPTQEFNSGYLSRFDGENWEAVFPMDGHVTALKVIDDTLYIGGKFDFAGPLNSSRIVKYDGENWYPIPDNPLVDMPNFISINAFEKYEGELYIGGVSPDVNDEDLLRYHNGSWQAVGDGVPGLHTKIDFLETYQGELYAAGVIMASEGNPGNGIQKWDGENWSQVGGGLNGTRMVAMQKYQNGLFVSGEYDYAGDVLTGGIARWNGVQWCGLHISTVNQVVPNMFVLNDALYMPLRQNADIPFFNYMTEVYKWIGDDDFGPCETIVSVEESKELGNEISVFPNPSSVTSTIKSDYLIKEIRLLDLSGKLILKANVNTNSYRIDLSDVQIGMYLLQVVTEKGIITKKLIRNS